MPRPDRATALAVPDRDASLATTFRGEALGTTSRGKAPATTSRGEALAAKQRKIAAMRADPRMHTSRGDLDLSLRLSHILHDSFGIFRRSSDEELKRYIHVELDGSGGYAKFG